MAPSVRVVAPAVQFPPSPFRVMVIVWPDMLGVSKVPAIPVCPVPAVTIAFDTTNSVGKVTNIFPSAGIVEVVANATFTVCPDAPATKLLGVTVLARTLWSTTLTKIKIQSAFDDIFCFAPDEPSKSKKIESPEGFCQLSAYP